MAALGMGSKGWPSKLGTSVTSSMEDMCVGDEGIMKVIERSVPGVEMDVSGDGLDCTMVQDDTIARASFGVADSSKDPVRPSIFFRDMVVGINGEDLIQADIPELEVVCMDDDVRIGYVDGTPSIDFAGTLHQQVDVKPINFVVVRVDGCSIVYSTLLTRVKTLWNFFWGNGAY
ncbi:hypothetical protein V6N13_098647 [Hibiscus sabdariffa]|uniref:PDZ domain-containing protein n=1 Tax=Hibiscus sabdariffa TaxID=183260 RepID=A0ABR2EEH6_9ROSI